jgi:hypothetical protein
VKNIFIVLCLIFGVSNICNAQNYYHNDIKFYYVEQEIECLSIAHLSDSYTRVFFWDMVQGEFTLLAVIAMPGDFQCYDSDTEHAISVCYLDHYACAFRVIKAKTFIESWEKEDPLTSNRNQPWFAQLLCPGLKMPQIPNN